MIHLGPFNLSPQKSKVLELLNCTGIICLYICCPVRVDLHLKCMLDVTSKLELIEMYRNVEACSSLAGDNIGFAHWVLGSREHSPALSAACAKLGQVSSPLSLQEERMRTDFTTRLCSEISRFDTENRFHHSALQHANQPNWVIGQSWWEQCNKLR